MKSSKMWHRNSYVHPLDASRGPAQRKVMLGGRLHEVSQVRTEAQNMQFFFDWSCNRRRDVNHAFQQLARILGKAWHLKLWVFFSHRYALLIICVLDSSCIRVLSFLFKIKNWALWIWKLDPQATYSRRDLLVIGKWMRTQKRKDVKKGEEKISYILIILWWHSISDLFVKQLEKLNLIADSRKTNKQNSTFCARLQAVKG